MNRLATMVAAATLTAACSYEDIYQDAQGGSNVRFGSPSRIGAYLDGKTLTMSASAVPSHPNGYDENVNFGQATQCYHQVKMAPLAGRYTVTSQLGTLVGAPNTGDTGSCDRSTMAAELSFDSTAALVDNVKGDGECFDFTITYPGFGQEGRGSLQDGGSTLVLELFFKDTAIGHRCDDGMVGDPTVTLSQAAFTGDARQTYEVQP